MSPESRAALGGGGPAGNFDPVKVFSGGSWSSNVRLEPDGSMEIRLGPVGQPHTLKAGPLLRATVGGPYVPLLTTVRGQG